MALTPTDITGIDPLKIAHYQDAATGKYYRVGSGGTGSAFRSDFTQKQIDNAIATWKAGGEVIPILSNPSELLNAWSVKKTADRKTENANVAQEEVDFQARQEARANGTNVVAPQNGIKSVVLTTPDGQQHRVEVDSSAYKKYIAQGAKESGGDIQYDSGGAPIQNQQNTSDTQQNISQQDYQLQQGETPEQYTARIAALRGEAPQATTSPATTSSYAGPSITDYLDSVGQVSDFGSRATLAKQYGISNYTGTAEQNTQLLNTLRTRNPQQPVQNTPAQTGSSAPMGGNYTSNEAPQAVDIRDTFSQFGVDLGDLQSFMSNPVASFEDTYDQLYKNLGIADLKSEASKLLGQATKYDEELADSITEINDDPWLTEGVRISRIRKETERMELKKAGVLNTLALYDKTIDSATDQARFLVKGLYDQYNADRNFTQDMIGFIYDRVDKANQAQYDLQESQDKKTQQSFENDLALAKLKIDEYNATKPSGGGSSNQTIDNERALFNQFNGEPIVKDFNTILAKKMSVERILQAKLGGPGDLATVYEFMKALDPTSVVRETEYASAAKSGNIFAGAYARYNGYLKEQGGFLPDSVKSGFMSIIDSKLAVQQQLYNNVVSQYQGVAERQGLNPQNVTVDYGAGANQTGNYDQYRSQLQPGEQLVLRNGVPTAIYLVEFNSKTDKAI